MTVSGRWLSFRLAYILLFDKVVGCLLLIVNS